MVKNLPVIQETWVWSLSQEDTPKKEMAIHSSILARRIPWTEEPGGLQSMWSQRVRHNWVTNTFRAFQEVIKVTWVIGMRPWSNKIDVLIREEETARMCTHKEKPTWGHSQKASIMTSTLSLASQPPELWENKLLLFRPPSLCFFFFFFNVCLAD